MNTSFKNKKVLAIGAHPDDVEFGCGATMAMLAHAGAELHFVVATDGNRGSRQHTFEKSTLISSRKEESLAAAAILGTERVSFLNEEDGNLLADISFKDKIVKAIRAVKPDLVFTHDPSWYYAINADGSASVNHTDHRACGTAVIDAVYPLARDLQSFPDHIKEGLDAHIVPELYLFTHGKEANYAFDVTGFVEAKIDAIAAHKSQIDDIETIAEMMNTRAATVGRKFGYEQGEGFTRLAFS